MHWMNGLNMGWGMGFWFLVLIVVISLFAWGFRRSEMCKPKDDDALEILKRRYARGEIDKEEFERIKQTLQSP